jgi:hypothetical protein
MKAIKLDENGDYVMVNGEFVIIEGDEQLTQEVRMAVQTNKGEWFLDVDEGLNRDALFAKKFDENNAKNSIIESLMRLSEPLSVETITFNRVNRLLLVDMILRKEDGARLIVEGVNI